MLITRYNAQNHKFSNQFKSHNGTSQLVDMHYDIENRSIHCKEAKLRLQKITVKSADVSWPKSSVFEQVTHNLIVLICLQEFIRNLFLLQGISYFVTFKANTHFCFSDYQLNCSISSRFSGLLPQVNNCVPTHLETTKSFYFFRMI